MAISINVTSITVVRLKDSTDSMYLKTDLPGGTWPFKDTVSVFMQVAQGMAEKYVEENFPGVPLEIIDTDKIRAEGDAK